ncbi:Uncharacterised protein [Serratia liquefaciens]|nr:Uncharacterised protein [Serratia liquefaciens]
MDEKSLYAHILNLSAPWQIQSLFLDEQSGSVTVIVGIAEHTQLTCPTCGKSCSIHDLDGACKLFCVSRLSWLYD